MTDQTRQTRALREILRELFASTGIDLVNVAPAGGETAADIRIEYQHTQTEPSALKMAILHGVGATAVGLVEVTPTPSRVDVTAQSPDDEPPLVYHLTRNDAIRAAVAIGCDAVDALRDLFVDVAEDADRFVDITDVRA